MTVNGSIFNFYKVNCYIFFPIYYFHFFEKIIIKIITYVNVLSMYHIILYIKICLFDTLHNGSNLA